MKRKMALWLTLALLTGTLAGCGDKPADSSVAPGEDQTLKSTEKGVDEGTSDDNSQEASKDEAGGDWTGDVSHIVVTYLTTGQTPADLLMVQDALNERTVKEIGVEVELKAVSAYDAFSQFPTWLATGETIDLMFPLLQSINTYVNQGLVDPLEDLIAENAPYIQKLTDEGYTFASNNTIDGHIWSVMQVPKLSGTSGGFVIGDQYLEELTAKGFVYEEDKVYTMDEMSDMLATLKELHPDMYPCGLVATNLTNSQFGYYDGVYDRLGSDIAAGVLMGTDSTTLTNLFKTEEYKSYVTMLREWYQAGYIHPDSATTDTSLDAQMNAGVSCGFFMSSAPTMKTDGRSLIRTSEIYMASQPAGGWVVPMTAKEPEAALRFLNLMYEDESIANLLQWGIEGVHYVVLDEENKLIGFPDGVDATNSGYYNTLGLYGDVRKVYVWSEGANQKVCDAYTEQAIKNPTKGVGMIYNPSEEMTVKIAAISAVVSQYMPALESGSVDVDTYYAEFTAALDAAGIEDVIADQQTQFDAFLAENK